MEKYLLNFSARKKSTICCCFAIAFVFTLLQTGVCLDEDFKNKEYELYKILFDNYTRSIRPVNNWADSINVNLNLNFIKIADVIENHQTITIYVAFEMRWKDSFLTWDPRTNGNISSINVPAEKVWIPDLHLFNSAAEDDRIYPLNVEVYYDGKVVAYPISQLYAHCDFDFTDFPYDTQRCDFIIGSIIEESKLKLNAQYQVMDSKYLSNPEWSLVKFSRTSPDWKFTVPGVENTNLNLSADWSVIQFTLDIKRHSSFYVNLFIWPLIFILFTTMSVFILPPDCIERVTMGILLLLTLVIMSLMLDSYTPKMSTNMSTISRLIGFTMFMVSWSIMASCVVIVMNRDRFIYVPIPMWIKNFLIKYVSKAICRYETLQAILTINQLRDEEIEVLDANQVLQNSQTNNANEGNSSSQAASSSTTDVSDLNQAKTLLVLINNQLAMLRMKIQEKDIKEQNKKDWHIVSSAFDRFFLLVYVIIMLLGLFIIFI